MPDFFCVLHSEGLAALTREDSRHALQSLRMREGELFRAVVDGRRYEAAFTALGGMAYARLGRELPGTELPLRVTLYQGIPKGDKMDLIVRQATELGAAAVVPCRFARCVAGPESVERRLERLGRIAKEAAMQSGRTAIPRVESPLPFEGLAACLRRHAQSLVAYEQERGQTLAQAWSGAPDVAIVIGPEGGLTEEEVAALPATPVSLGPRILRTETAGTAAVAMLAALHDRLKL